MLRRRQDQGSILHLKRFWDELVQGEPATPGQSELDPALAATVRRLHARDDAPAADPIFAARLLDDLFDAPQLAPLPHVAPLDPASGWTEPTNGRAAPLPSRWPIRPRRRTSRWGFAPLATAALLLLTLGLVFLALGPGRSDDGRPATDPGEIPTRMPASVGTVEQTLLSVTLPAEALPRAGRISAALAHLSVPPGTRSSWEPSCCPGPLLEFVVAGTYAVRAQADIRVLRADGTADVVPARPEVVRRSGDGLISRNETVVEAANIGAGSVELLSWALLDDPGTFGGHSLPGWAANKADVQRPRTVPPGAATLRLRRIVLAPDASLAVPPGALQMAVTLPENAAGTPVAPLLEWRSDGTISNVGWQGAAVYVLTLEPAGSTTPPPAARLHTP